MLETVWLVHPEREMADAWRERFAGLPNVRVVQARFEDLDDHDCFVTAGNAFGMMTAGIDAAVADRFGGQFVRSVQDTILRDYFGEQPVGTAFVIATGEPSLPFVAHAPTMRVPGNIEGTDKVYTSTWAALLAMTAHNAAGGGRIRVAAFSAMGTGFGGVPFSEAARQMAAAYRH